MTMTEPGLIKIDVEGAELEVLQGMLGLVARVRPLVLIEILPVYEISSPRWQRQLELQSELNRLNYRMFRVLKRPDSSLEGILPIQEIGVHGNVEWSNYLCVPEDTAKEIESLIPICTAGRELPSGN